LSLFSFEFFKFFRRSLQKKSSEEEKAYHKALEKDILTPLQTLEELTMLDFH